MTLKQSSYSIPRDLLEEVLEVLAGHSTYDDGGSLSNNEDVCSVKESLNDEIEKQDYMAAAVGWLK